MNQQTEVEEEISFDNLSFLRVRPSQTFNPSILENHDAIILEYFGRHNVLEAIKQIRSHNEKLVYITPIFLLIEGGNTEDSIVALADGVIEKLTNLDSAASVTRKIISRI